MDDILAALKMQMQDYGITPGQFCCVCGEVNPFALTTDKIKLFEGHHQWGKAYSKETVIICLNCHAVTKHFQNAVHPDWRKKQLPPERRLKFVLLSQAALEYRMAEVKLRLIRQTMEGDADERNSGKNIYNKEGN